MQSRKGQLDSSVTQP
nr:unnamed protein product [Callosobruchus chinensis]